MDTPMERKHMTRWYLLGAVVALSAVALGLWLALASQASGQTRERTTDTDIPCWANGRKPHPTCTPGPLATSTALPTPIASPTPCYGPDPYWSCVATIEQFEDEVQRLINEHRQLPPHDPWYQTGIALTFHPSLRLAQEEWAIQMIGDPSDPNDDQCYHGDYGGRAARYGYTGWAWGEIGACGYATPADTVQGWIDSPGHHRVMDEPNTMTEFGAGAAKYANNYWQVWVIIGCDGGIPCMSAVGAP